MIVAENRSINKTHCHCSQGAYRDVLIITNNTEVNITYPGSFGGVGERESHCRALYMIVSCDVLLLKCFLQKVKF